MGKEKSEVFKCFTTKNCLPDNGTGKNRGYETHLRIISVNREVFIFCFKLLPRHGEFLLHLAVTVKNIIL